ncbi:uncharacterized protein LOC111895725 isoform X1 [Lactuca sativa]|uniref:PX domain-containing protein n=2 Tax=Lactuca sativa TaxID=4236 RepID=A0A9R1V442_LACSA|nr:uncharacterized protein LOC111895725 isoform X1 [Lactuca sativa]KAJ0198177.1 hypothetical protein LSAT_V11C700377070 [Lactuca sativa]
METLQDLIEEAKLRTVWWAICIFAVTYFLTHTSKSMWMNVPIAILLVSGVHILITEVDFHWKIRKSRRHSYLAHLEKKQLSVNDSRLNTLPPPPKWKRKIDSPVVEAAMEDFTNKILQEFVVDLWYSDITPDKEAPQLIHAIIMDILAEISMRVKDINLVDMLTRDVVDLIGDHLELFRKNQASIGREVMVTLSSEERDERLKHHLMASKELHPALISPESEYKFLKRIMGALLAAVLRPREAQCPLVRCITRELLTCLVMEPVMRFASPGRINELIEGIFLATNKGEKETADDQSNVTVQPQNQPSVTNNEKGPESNIGSSSIQKLEKTPSTSNIQKESSTTVNPSATMTSGPIQDESIPTRTSDWARVLEAATQRRTEVLQPENLENMWTKGRNYMKKSQKNSASGIIKGGINESSNLDTGFDQQRDQILDGGQNKTPTRLSLVDDNLNFDFGSDGKLKRLNSASESNIQTLSETASPIQVGGSGTIIPEFYSVNPGRDNDAQSVNNIASDNKLIRTEGYVPKLRCRVLGAFFENIDSKSFAVYSIAVTDADNKTWFVKRRYRNFERLHRHLKDIPNYTLHLPPKRIFSSSTEDAFVHQRCIQLDKYLKELLSIANIAEQHEVWDFLSMSSKSYSFGRSSSAVRALAVNVDDAVDDIVRQFKGGIMRKSVGPGGSPSEFSSSSSSAANRNMTWETNEANDSPLKQPIFDMGNNNIVSDYEEGEKDNKTIVNNEEMESMGQVYGGYLDNEVNFKAGLSPKIVNKNDEQNKNLVLEKKNSSEVRSEVLTMAANFPSTSKEDPLGMPAEWSPPNVSVPLLNLVDKIFQLNRRGWLRRQVFWMSKQILQLMMEDAIDDWLLRQIQLLRRDDIVAQGIRWIQDILWPEGTFFLKVKSSQTDSSQTNEGAARAPSGSKANKQGSFEEQLEAARRASDIKKMIFKGAPTTLVSLIGRKQYKRCAKDVYYFLQSAVCLKQLAYGLLELVLITVFPELQEIISNVHEKQKGQGV